MAEDQQIPVPASLTPVGKPLSLMYARALYAFLTTANARFIDPSS